MIGLLSGGAALAGTYGGVHRDYAGYGAGVDCSVGSWSDHAAEGRAFEQCKKDAEVELTKREPELARMYRHFLDGKHGRRALVARLQPSRRTGDWEHSVRVELRFPRPEDVIGPPRPIAIDLFVAEQPSEETRTMLALDFALSQLAPGGALAAVKPRANPDAADTQQLLKGMGSEFRMSPFVAAWMMTERRAEIAELARRAEPLPKKYAWQTDQRSGLVEARVLDAFFNQRALGDDAFAMAAKLDDASDVALLMALLFPDARTIERAAALPKVLGDSLRAYAKP